MNSNYGKKFSEISVPLCAIYFMLRRKVIVTLFLLVSLIFFSLCDNLYIDRNSQNYISIHCGPKLLLNV